MTEPSRGLSMGMTLYCQCPNGHEWELLVAAAYYFDPRKIPCGDCGKPACRAKAGRVDFLANLCGD